MTTENPLQHEFEYYLANQEKFLKDHAGKVLVIINEQVIGVFEDEVGAIEETVKTYELGTFLVQRCTPGSGDYTQTFHSRVVFS